MSGRTRWFLIQTKNVAIGIGKAGSELRGINADGLDNLAAVNANSRFNFQRQQTMCM